MSVSVSRPSVRPLAEPEGAFILDLGAFPCGAYDALSRIPGKTAGMYSWFRVFDYPDDPEELADQIINDLYLPRFLPRTGTVKPYYEVTICSRGWFTKEPQLRQALRDSAFRSTLIGMLRQSVYFQSPLYIGKSCDVRSRTEEHLAADSPLRARLAAVGIDIEKCLLLIVPTSETLLASSDPEQAITSLIDQTEPAQRNMTNELLLEDVISRLFQPLFTARLG
jgi:hypothetical protein